jgi:hypothetical protein
MAESKVWAFRLPRDLARRIERHAARAAERAGVEVSRAAIVKKLLVLGLEVEEARERSKKRK